MPRDGIILGRPPVPIAASAGRQLLVGLLRGVTSYQAAAGLGGAPLAMPPLQRFRAPGALQADPAQQHRYTLKPGLSKQRLTRIAGNGQAANHA